MPLPLRSLYAISIRICLLCFLSAALLTGKGQNVLQQKRYSSNNNYKDFVIADRQIWALTTKGKLRVFDLQTGRRIADAPVVDSPIVAIARNASGNIALAFNGSISLYDRGRRSWSKLGSYKDQVFGIVFNTANNCFLILNKGVEELALQKYYFPDSSLNPQVFYRGTWFKPPVYFIDARNNLWIGFGHGEWGGDLFIFNTIDHKFVIPQMGKYEIDLNPVKSIFSDGSAVYMSTGLQHFETSGSIVRFDGFVAKPVFNSTYYSKGKNDENVPGEYIGPAAYNREDHRLYFYSQHGIFRGNPEKDLSTIEKWEKVFVPNLYWTNGQPDAVGSPMNVLKMEFADSKTLVFVSQLDGIGVYDGVTITLIK